MIEVTGMLPGIVKGAHFTAKSISTGIERTMVFEQLTQEEFDRKYALWKSDKNVLVQDVFKELDENEREFLMTGLTPEEWNQMFSINY